jgi:methyl-accepting chemotaxis protein
MEIWKYGNTNIMRLSLGRKISILITLISIIFVTALLITKSNTSTIANLFSDFYSDDYLTLQKSEKVKASQIDIMLNIRGLQIAYLLNLDKQTQGYLVNIREQLQVTPKLIEDLESNFTGERDTIQALREMVMNYNQASKLFIGAMQNSPTNKAPFSVFSQFMASYQVLISSFDELTKSIDEKGISANARLIESIDRANFIFYIAIVTATLLAVFFTYYIVSGIQKGVKDVKDGAKKLASGDLTVKLDVKTNDEISDLALSINDISSRLRGTISDITESANAVNDNCLTVLKYNGDIHHLSEGMTDNTTQVVTAIEEMSATSRSIAENTTETASAAGEMQVLAHKGLASSGQTIKAISDMVQGLIDTSSVVSKLQGEISNIETILDVIRGISEQTNLLALNAAIEAARAGEQGRGFAVVADEVRALAQRSQNSVNEIESLLTELSTAGKDAGSRMDSSTRKADMAKQQVQNNNELISQILQEIEEVNAQAQQIATAAEEQSAVSEDISKNMHAVQTLTYESSELANKNNQYSVNMGKLSQNMLEKTNSFTL